MQGRATRAAFGLMQRVLGVSVLAALAVSFLSFTGITSAHVVDAGSVLETSTMDTAGSGSLPSVTGPVQSAPVQQPPPRSMMKGVNYRSWWPGSYSTSASDQSMANVRATGANWISIIVFGYQKNATAKSISKGPDTPSDADLDHVIRQAHTLGLKVMLKPQMLLSDDPSGASGPIGKGFTKDEQWDSWFSSYRGFVDHYADIAQRNNVELLCAGTELWGTTRQSARWRAVISELRHRYDGPITYSALESSPGFTGEDASIDWWDALDYIGVSAYYPLTDQDDPTLDQLQAAWQPWIRLLSGVASRWQRPVILTEIGYRSIDGADRRPSDWSRSGPVDLQAQATCYQAAFDSLWSQPWLAGMFWWEWGTLPDQGASPDTGYEPHNKPAEQILREWYSRPRADPHLAG